MRRFLSYLANLTTGRIILWCYVSWYDVNVVNHFDARPQLWVTSLGLATIIGFALLISTRASRQGTTPVDGWQILRLFLMPFCVTSFAALVKDADFILIFPPNLRENLVGLTLVAAFVIFINGLKRTSLVVSRRPAGGQ